MGRGPIRGPILLLGAVSLCLARWKISMEGLDEESGMKNPGGEGGGNEERAGCGKKDVC